MRALPHLQSALHGPPTEQMALDQSKQNEPR